MTVTSYPLSWPAGFPRAKYRENARFKTDFDRALHNVRKSLELFGKDSGKPVVNPILSSNMNPLSNKTPDDPGVAVWFTWDGLQVCIPVDRYRTPSLNLQAIHHIIEARRVELRHGTLALVRATFQGFTALPAPKNWRDVFGFLHAANPTREEIDKRYRERAKTAHPDAGGSETAMAELNHARDIAFKEIGA